MVFYLNNLYYLNFRYFCTEVVENNRLFNSARKCPLLLDAISTLYAKSATFFLAPYISDPHQNSTLLSHHRRLLEIPVKRWPMNCIESRYALLHPSGAKRASTIIFFVRLFPAIIWSLRFCVKEVYHFYEKSKLKEPKWTPTAKKYERNTYLRTVILS